jgi:hypothetical protein
MPPKPSRNARFALLATGVIISHTLVTILEESLFSNEAFLRDAGGAFMTLVMYSLSVAWYGLTRMCGSAARSPAASGRLSRREHRRELLTVVTL